MMSSICKVPMETHTKFHQSIILRTTTKTVQGDQIPFLHRKVAGLPLTTKDKATTFTAI